jgi:hypothetical protein
VGWGLKQGLNFSAVVGPLQKGLSLFSSAGDIAFAAVFAQLADVSFHCFPSGYLSFVLGREAPSHKIPAIPLKPSARVAGINPPLFPPDGKRLACADFEIIKGGVMSGRAEFCFFKPFCRKLPSAVGHILSSEDTQPKHFFGSKLRLKIRVEILAGRSRNLITIIFLHLVVDDNRFDFCRFQKFPLSG